MAIFGPTTVTAVSNSAVQVYTPTAGGVQQNPTLVNVGANTVAVGQSGVTFSTGLLLAAGAQVTLTGTEEAIYAIATSSSAKSVVQSGLATVDAVV